MFTVILSPLNAAPVLPMVAAFTVVARSNVAVMLVAASVLPTKVVLLFPIVKPRIWLAETVEVELNTPFVDVFPFINTELSVIIFVLAFKLIEDWLLYKFKLVPFNKPTPLL